MDDILLALAANHEMNAEDTWEQAKVATQSFPVYPYADDCGCCVIPRFPRAVVGRDDEMGVSLSYECPRTHRRWTCWWSLTEADR
jgi:hypothetical protein